MIETIDVNDELALLARRNQKLAYVLKFFKLMQEANELTQFDFFRFFRTPDYLYNKAKFGNLKEKIRSVFLTFYRNFRAGKVEMPPALSVIYYLEE